MVRTTGSPSGVTEGKYVASAYDAFNVLIASQALFIDHAPLTFHARVAPGVSIFTWNRPTSINIEASDPLLADGNPGSGVGPVSLVQTRGGRASYSFDGKGAAQLNVQVPPVGAGNLAEGWYELAATDVAGNSIVPIKFNIDGTPPRVSHTFSVTRTGVDLTNTVTVLANDGPIGSGVRRFSIQGPAQFFDVIFASVPVASVAYDDIDPGQYTVTVYDAAGNKAQDSFFVSPPIAEIRFGNNGAHDTAFVDFQGPAKVLPVAADAAQIHVTDFSGITSYSISVNGLPYQSQAYASPQGRIDIALKNLPNGFYRLEFDDADGFASLATYDQYTYRLSLDVARSIARFDPSTVGPFPFAFKLAFNVANTGPGAPGAGVLTLHGPPDPISGIAPTISQNLGGIAAAADVTLGPMRGGDFTVTATDANDQVVSLAIPTQVRPGNLFQPIHCIASGPPPTGTNNPSPALNSDGNVMCSPNGSNGEFGAQLLQYEGPPIPIGNGATQNLILFSPGGWIDSPIIDLMTPVLPFDAGTLRVETPDGAIGTALGLYSPPLLNLHQLFLESTALPNPAGTIAMSWSVTSGDDPANLPAGMINVLTETDQLAPDDTGPRTDTPGRFPIPLGRYFKYRAFMSANAAGTASPEFAGTSFPIQYAIVQAFPVPSGAVYEATSPDQVNGAPVFKLKSGVPTLTIMPSPSGAPGAPAGWSQLTKVYLADPPLLAAEPAFLTMNFSSVAALQSGIDPASLAVWQALPGQPFILLSGQMLDPVGQQITAALKLQPAAYYAIFGRAPTPPPPPPKSGPANSLAIATDPQGRLWSVVQANSTFQLARFSPTGAFQSAVTLADAASGSNWAINFDTAGFVYAVGAASGPYTVGTDLSVYKATLDPSPVLISSTGFHGGVNGQALGFDASGDAWITGAIQQGSAQNGPPKSVLALWRYCIQSGLLTLTTTYSRAGTDAGFGVRVAGNSVWVAGYSLNPQVQGLDLGLWQFDSQGKSLIGGPFFRAGYLTSLQNADVSVKLATNGTSLFVAAERTSAGVNDLAFLEYNLSGQVVSERAWHSSSGLNEAPHGLSLDPGGNLLVAGGQKASNSSTLGVWKYSSQGGLLAARTDPGVFRANGIALQQSNVWLAVNGSSVPYLFQGSQALLGSDVFISSASADATPPVSSIAIGAPSFAAPDGARYVSPASSITFSASDPNNPDGSPGSGVARIEVSLDSAPFAAFFGVLSLVEGNHYLQFRAIDKAGNVETPHTLFLRSDATAPRTGLALGAPQFSAGVTTYVSTATQLTLLAADPLSNGIASGVKQTFYSIGGGSATLYSAPFTLTTPDGVKTVSAYSVDNVANQEVAKSITVALDASAPQTSLALLGGRQFPGPNAWSFYASSTTVLSFISTDPVVNGVASGLAQTQYQDNGGVFASYTSPFTYAEGVNVVAYQSQDHVQNAEVLHSTVVLIDATPPATTISIGNPTYTASDGTIYVSTCAPISFSAADPVLVGSTVPGSGVSRIDLAKDTTSFSLYSSAIALPESRHTLLYRAVDNVANAENPHVIAIQSDGTPPVSSLAIGQPQYQLPDILLVSARTPLSISAVDPVAGNLASGVKDTSYRVSDAAPGVAPFQAYGAAFTLPAPDANKVIEFYSRDNVLNTEVLKSSTVLLDSTPPEITLISPSTCDTGICQAVKGRFPVLGTAKDLHFASYTLAFAPGKDAASGFTTINVGNVAVSSASLGTWDTTPLSGWQTLRLVAVDLVQNVSTVTMNVFVGDPGNLMILGGKDIFAGPQGVAIGPTGQLYVADTRHNRIAIFSAQGAFVKAFGGEEGSASPLVLHHPEAVTVDPVGGIYAADTDADKVLKLSAMGQVQAYFSGFKRPSGVAVDLQGNVYVSDAGNHQIKKLSPTGSVLQTITLPPLPALHGEKGDDEGRGRGKDDRRPDIDRDDQRLGRPRQIALDSSGAIYVADSQASRALKYDPNGQLLLAVPIVRIAKDGRAVPGRPTGVAVNSNGDCWLVSDTHNGLVHRFDLQGDEDLVFQTFQRTPKDEDHRRNDDHEDEAESKPQGLAVDAQGVLYVADRGKNAVMTFSVPTGMPPVLVRPGAASVELNRLTVAGNFTREDGGRLRRFDKAALLVSSGTLSEDAELFISTPVVRLQAEEDVKARKWVEAGLIAVSTAAVFGPEDTAFGKDVMVVVPYDQLLVQSNGLSEMNLQVYYWNPDKQFWQWLPSSVNLKDRTVSATTKHFSIFQVAGKRPKDSQQQ